MERREEKVQFGVGGRRRLQEISEGLMSQRGRANSQKGSLKLLGIQVYLDPTQSEAGPVVFLLSL